MQTVQYMYSKSFRKAAAEGTLESDVAAHDHVVVTGDGQADMAASCPRAFCHDLEARIYRYIDWYGASYFDRASSGVPRWADGPGDYGFPPLKTPRSPYLYRIDQFHELRLAHTVWDIMAQYPDQAGVFLDDFSELRSHRYWRVHEYPELEAIAWPLAAPGDWPVALQQSCERVLRSLMTLRSQALVVNGDSRCAGPRLWESVGKWVGLEEIAKGCQPGDHMLVKGVGTDRRSWLTASRPEGGYMPGTSFEDIFRDCYALAREKDLVIGLSLEDNPDEGGSSLCTHAFSDPGVWSKLYG